MIDNWYSYCLTVESRQAICLNYLPDDIGFFLYISILRYIPFDPFAKMGIFYVPILIQLFFKESWKYTHLQIPFFNKKAITIHKMGTYVKNIVFNSKNIPICNTPIILKTGEYLKKYKGKFRESDEVFFFSKSSSAFRQIVTY